MNVFITGGAGFIGRRLAAALRGDGHQVAIFDSLIPQVHSDPNGAVAELQGLGCAFVRGDVRDAEALREALTQSEAGVIVHLAAETGTGQSYDLPAHYCEVNVTGTANLVEVIRELETRGVPIDRVLLASSRAIYGEGEASNAVGQRMTAVPRRSVHLSAGDFAPKDASGSDLEPLPSSAATTEPAPASVYASTKLMQEYVLRQGLQQTGIGCGILRLQNVYGAGQALHNPYTGVLSIFAQQLLKGAILRIFEDGEIVRDFVHVSDVARAFHRLCAVEVLPAEAIDIGSGEGLAILDVAQLMIGILGLEGKRYRITGEFRPGDIRHARADISAAAQNLGWSPERPFVEGIAELLEWARTSP